jgi:GxxExxY protein
MPLAFLSNLSAMAALRDFAPRQFTGRHTPSHLTEGIIGAAIRVHRRLGPGLLESAYEACVAYELGQIGISVQQQKGVPVIYEGVKLECGFRADMIVEGLVAVEFKCKEALHPVDHAQVLSHLRLLGLQVGLLINFHVVLRKDGITRVVNNYREDARVAGGAEEQILNR